MAKRSPQPSAKRASPGSRVNGLSLAAIGLLVASVLGVAYLLSRPPEERPVNPGTNGPVQPTASPVAGNPSDPVPESNPAGDRPAAVDQASFIGSEACAECHREVYDQWRGSTHARAGGRPDEVDLLAPFDGTPIEFADATVVPSRTDDGIYQFQVRLKAGGNPFTVQADLVVGGGHMVGGGTQSFFNELPDGTYRFLPFDFVRKENTWFVQLKKDKTWVPVTPAVSLQQDLAHWPPHRVLGTSTEFSNCQNCHGSQITLQKHPEEARHVTAFQTLAINCESCHGPGREHVRMARQGEWTHHSDGDIGLTDLSLLTKDQSLDVCFQCHARKEMIQETPYLPGKQFTDFFSLKMPVFGKSPFKVDGRVDVFAYQLNHLFSDCYLNGSMTCVDCHDPHSQNYRDVFGQALKGRHDDRQCTSCHASKADNPEAHTHHPPESSGARCTSCHMPYLQHAGVGRQLQFARSDHTIAIPRPSFDRQIGIENACQKCHQDKDLAWQDSWIQKWYGQVKPHHPMIRRLIEGTPLSDRARAADRLLAPDLNHPLGQMTGLATFVKRFIQPGRRGGGVAQPGDEIILPRLLSFVQSDDDDLQALALLALQVGFAHDPKARDVLDAEMKEIRAGNRDALRHRWSVLADQFGQELMSRGDGAGGLTCFRAALEVHPENIVALSHLAMTQMRLGQIRQALETQGRAIALDPRRGTLYFQLAQLHFQNRDLTNAIAALEAGLEHAPDDLKAMAMLEVLKRGGQGSGGQPVRTP